MYGTQVGQKLFKVKGGQHLKNSIYAKEELSDELWKILADTVTEEICKTDNYFLNSKYLWEYILVEIIQLVVGPYRGDVTPELLIRVLEEEDLLSHYIQEHQKAELIRINELLEDE